MGLTMGLPVEVIGNAFAGPWWRGGILPVLLAVLAAGLVVVVSIFVASRSEDCQRLSRGRLTSLLMVQACLLIVTLVILSAAYAEGTSWNVPGYAHLLGAVELAVPFLAALMLARLCMARGGALSIPHALGLVLVVASASLIPVAGVWFLHWHPALGELGAVGAVNGVYAVVWAFWGTRIETA